MKTSPTGLTALLVFAAYGAHQVAGHGYLVRPLAKFISVNIDKTQYSSTIDANKLFPGGTFNTAPELNIKSFVANYKKSKYKSIKAMIEDNQVLVTDQATPTCGYSSPEKTSYGALNDTVYWGRNDDITLDEGLVHPGPCEVWCDDNQIQQNMECQKAYTPASGKGAAPVPVDNSKCKSAKRLTFYWVAMHGATWQVYINCVNINGSKGGAGSSTSISQTTPASNSSPSTSNTTPSSNSSPSTSNTTPSSNSSPSTANTTPSSNSSPSTSNTTPSSNASPSTSNTTPSTNSSPSTSNTTSSTNSSPSTSNTTPSTNSSPSTSNTTPSTNWSPSTSNTTPTPNTEVGGEASTGAKCARRRIRA